MRLEDDRVVLLDQRRLPDEAAELQCRSAVELAEAIRTLAVRGAPAIGVAAAYGYALAARTGADLDEAAELDCRSALELAEAIRTLAVRGAPAIGVAAAYGYALAARTGEDLDEAAETLAASRPTAVNLSWALEQMRALPPDPEALAERARELHAEEVERCRRMAEHAASLFEPGTQALTHCNAGGLATAGYGTAVGALRAGWERGLVRAVLVDETRPLLQGSRLTAWELEAAGIPSTVIADAAAGHMMAAGEVDCVVTGADRIAANGDTANKIGTYTLAVLAAHHGVPFYVVAPTSTLDPETATGAEIPIEERDGAEITGRFPARNPAFDVTPAALITAIVTEEGVHRPPYSESLPRRAAAPA